MHVPLGDTYYFQFTSRQFSTGAPFTLAGTPSLAVYEENNLTQITTGITLTVDYDAITGLNDVAVIATSGNGYEVGKYYSVSIAAGTVDSVSVVGEVVGHFRVMPAENQTGVPIVDTGYIAGTAQTARDIGSSVLLSNGTGTGQISLSSGAVTTGTNNDKTGYSLTATTGLGNQTANITGSLSGSVGSVTGNVGGNVVGSTASVTGAVGSVTGNVGGNVTGSVGSISGITFPTNFGDLSITVTTGRVDVGSIGGTTQTANDNGADINTLITNIATLLTRLPGTITFTVAGQVDANIQSINDVTITGDGSATPFTV